MPPVQHDEGEGQGACQPCKANQHQVQGLLVLIQIEEPLLERYRQ